MPRTLHIHPILNGWIVEADCQTLAYTDKGKLLADFATFLDDPKAVERRILETEAINRKLTMSPTLAEPEVRGTYGPPQALASNAGNALIEEAASRPH